MPHYHSSIAYLMSSLYSLPRDSGPPPALSSSTETRVLHHGRGPYWEGLPLYEAPYLRLEGAKDPYKTLDLVLTQCSPDLIWANHSSIHLGADTPRPAGSRTRPDAAAVSS